MDDAVPKRNARRNDKTHQKWTPRNKTGTKIQGGYGGPKESNIGVFRESEICALLCIIYMGDMAEDLAALTRRSQLPIRIIQDRPHGENKKRLWGVIKTEAEEQYSEIQATRAIKNATSNVPRKSRPTMIRAQKNDKENRAQHTGEDSQTNNKKQQGKEHTETGTEIPPPRKHHIQDDDWRKVDIRTLTSGTRLEKNNEGKCGKEIQRFQPNETQQSPGELKGQLIRE